MLKNQKGFALATTLALLPVFIAALIACYFILGGMHLDLAAKQVCRQNGIQTQKQIRPLLTLLISLNVPAKALKVQHNLALIRVAACAVTRVCFPSAMANLNRINRTRKNLDQKQKQIIRQANTILKLQHQRTQWQLRAQTSNKRFSLYKISGVSVSGKAPKLPVVPESSDVAPSYRTEDHFTEKQALAHRWQYHLELIKILGPLQRQGFQFQKNCAVSLKKEDSSWNVITVEDKSLSKSSWSFF